MIERRDEELSRIYRDADGPRPPQRVDDNIIAASQRVAGARPRPAGVRFARRWGTPFALAATVVVTSTLALMLFERESGLDTMAPKAPRADRPAKVSPAEPVRADRGGTPSPEVLQPIAPAPPISQAAPAFVPGVPSTSEVVRKREEAMQAPAPAAGALPESAPTPQSAEVVRALSRSAAVADAKERTPEKWLEDIRKLRTENKTTEAERELAEFKKRYPDYILPEDLR
jgi:hypothetical protein